MLTGPRRTGKTTLLKLILGRDEPTEGTVELTDGSKVQGFVCEAHAAAGATDITQHGGWRAWLASKKAN